MAERDDDEDPYAPRQRPPPELDAEGAAAQQRRYESVFGAYVALSAMRARERAGTPDYQTIVREAKKVAYESTQAWWDVLAAGDDD